MGNFSRDPARELQLARARGYIGLRVEQGVPVLDRDLNLLADLVSSSVREILARHLGSGLADRGDAFRVVGDGAANDVRLLAPPEGGGACLVAGIEVTIDRALRYAEQRGAPALTTPTADREDVVYLDVWVEEVGASGDVELRNETDVGTPTSVRLRPAWRLRVAEGRRQVPDASPGHAHHPLAMLVRPAGTDEIRPEHVLDLRRTGLNLADLARRVERLEAELSSPVAPPARWRRETAPEAVR